MIIFGGSRSGCGVMGCLPLLVLGMVVMLLVLVLNGGSVFFSPSDSHRGCGGPDDPRRALLYLSEANSRVSGFHAPRYPALTQCLSWFRSRFGSKSYHCYAATRSQETASEQMPAGVTAWRPHFTRQ